jgi:fluoroacetyl-CoA thioesterase
VRPILPGEERSVTFEVTAAMEASFGGRRIHPVLSTWALVHHLEWAARLVIEPALEEGEEGVGAGVDIRHLGPAPIGSSVTVTARAVGQKAASLVCEVEAFCGERAVAKGWVFQAVLPRERWDALRMAGPPAAGGEE